MTKCTHHNYIVLATEAKYFFIRELDSADTILYSLCDNCYHAYDFFHSNPPGLKQITQEQYLNYQVLQ